MAFEKGNRYGREGESAQPFVAAVRRALAQGDGKRLRNIAEKLLDAAAAGEPWAIKEVADRLDGKAKQAVHITSGGDPRGLSLEELRDEIARTIAGAGSADSGADIASPVH